MSYIGGEPIFFGNAEYALEDLTPWFAADQRPERVGVYAMAYEGLRREDGSVFGWGYAYWNGLTWKPVLTGNGAAYWGHYIGNEKMIWRGLVKEGKLC